MSTNENHETCWHETNKNIEKLKAKNKEYSVCISSIIDLLKSCENKVPRFVDIINKQLLIIKKVYTLYKQL